MRAAAEIVAYVAGIALLAWLLHRCEPLARAEPAPLVDVSGAWSLRAGPSAELRALYALRGPLALLGESRVALERVGSDTTQMSGAAPLLEGVLPSLVGVGPALRWAWFRESGWSGYVVAGVDAGIADAQYASFGGAHAVVDLDYVHGFGDLWLVGTDTLSTAYRFGVQVYPVIRWLSLLYECDSADGGPLEQRKPCGLGLGVRLVVPASSVHVELRGAGRLNFHDLEGNTSAHGGGDVVASVVIW